MFLDVTSLVKTTSKLARLYVFTLQYSRHPALYFGQTCNHLSVFFLQKRMNTVDTSVEFLSNYYLKCSCFFGEHWTLHEPDSRRKKRNKKLFFFRTIIPAKRRIYLECCVGCVYDAIGVEISVSRCCVNRQFD